jgi:hypothetical protein
MVLSVLETGELLTSEGDLQTILADEFPHEKRQKAQTLN